MTNIGKVVAGRYIDATISVDRKGELKLSLGFQKIPNLTAATVAAWEEIIDQPTGGTGQVNNAALPGFLAKATNAAAGVVSRVSSLVDSAGSSEHTVRVDWFDGTESLTKLPDNLFQHFAITLKFRQIVAAPPTPTVPESAPVPDPAPSRATGQVIGGNFVNATVNIDQSGNLGLFLGSQEAQNVTADTVSAWEEIVAQAGGGAAGVVSKVGTAVARSALPSVLGKAAAAAVGSIADIAISSVHTVRVEWIDGTQSLMKLPNKLFQHLAIMLKDHQMTTVTSTPTTSEVAAADAQSTSVIDQVTKIATPLLSKQPDIVKQIAALAELHAQGVLTDDEFAAKKAELLDRM